MTSPFQRQDRWPFIVIRHDTGVNDAPDVFARLMECHARHQGACDEFWFATGSRKTVSDLEREVETFARYRPLCDSAGILLGYQQGLTLGHGEVHDGRAKPGEQSFPDDAWQRGADGARLGFLCPRSPFVLDYEREYAKTVMRVANPSSYWIDDDLRLGVVKSEGCFCDRCLAAFREKTGFAVSREELVGRLFAGRDRNGAEDPAAYCRHDPLREAWCAFNAESLAIYAAAVRQAADELGSPCRLGYQSVSADRTYTALDYRPLLEALSGAGRAPVGIRPGPGFYTEAEPRGMVAKCLAIAREAERCKDYMAAQAAGIAPRIGTLQPRDGLVATVCYEEENYPRRVLHKSPGAIMAECALALASGCDSLSLYWFSALQREPVEEYDRFLATRLRARPYFERLAASTRRTRLGGLARFVGAAAAQTADYDLYDQTDFDLACAGIPVTVAGPGASAWYLTEKSRREMTEIDEASFAAGAPPPAVVDVADIGRYPTAPRRLKLLDALDAATGGVFPVRIDECRPLRVLPRIRGDGSLDSVTLLNLSIGDTDAFSVRVRRPVGGGGILRDPKGREEAFALETGLSPAEGVARIENIPGWGVATLFFGE